MAKGMAEVQNIIGQALDQLPQAGGVRDVTFVACGGSLASSYPARYLLNAESRTLRVVGYNSSEFVHAMPAYIGKNSLVICTSTKATPETVDGIRPLNWSTATARAPR